MKYEFGNFGAGMKRYWQIIMVLMCLLIISCSANKTVRDGNEAKKVVENQTEISSLSPFVLGSGDKISISIWRNDNLNRNIQIDPSGYIYIPLAGEIKAAGLTIAQLRKEIASQLSKCIINPQVDINVTSITSQRVYVLGEVKRPGAFTLNRRIMAFEAISQAGGFTSDANEGKVLLLRDENSAPKVCALNLDIRKIVNNKAYENIFLKSGDILYVPPSFIANFERFMIRLNNILNPLLSIERGAVLWPQLIDALKGTEEKGGSVVVPP